MAAPQPTHTQPEIWKPIPGYEGVYEASDHGRVRSVDRVIPYVDGRMRHQPGKPKKLSNDGRGYLTVSLQNRTRFVHQLVLEAFVGTRGAGEQVRHLDNNPMNNRLENLAWGTASENILDQVKAGTHNNARKTHCLRGHEFTPENTIKNGPNGRGCRTCNKIRWDLTPVR
ncbi:NUMOD4 motif-containing HNH endonuclease [Corynebacterium sp. ACRQJ]|uniref:NUMOD4 motif-containing HNH endonuclease n=1 Tax=Corynebacterium sp. ACRQJ TaxID=2918189 RepID=UPI00351D6827